MKPLNHHAFRRRLLTVTAPLALLFVVCAWPWIGLRDAFATGYCLIAANAFDRITFGEGGRARIAASSGEGRVMPAGGVGLAPDATVTLSVAGQVGELEIGVNLRRDAYLPLLLFVCLFAATPLRRRNKIHGMMAGGVLVFLASFAALLLLIVWSFCNQSQLVYPSGTFASLLIDLACRLLLAPPANRIIGPAALAALLALLGMYRQQRRQQPQEGPQEQPRERSQERPQVQA